MSVCPVATPPTLLMSLVHVMDLIQKRTHSLCLGDELEMIYEYRVDVYFCEGEKNCHFPLLWLPKVFIPLQSKKKWSISEITAIVDLGDFRWCQEMKIVSVLLPSLFITFNT